MLWTIARTRHSPCRSPIACTSVGRHTAAAGRISCIIHGKTRHGVSLGCEQERRDESATIDPQRHLRPPRPHRLPCPPLSAEVFPYEFYKLVPAGVTLVITTLTVIERRQSEVDAAYEMSMRAARELAAAGVDLVFLGGVPVNLSRGDQNAQDMLRTLAAEVGVKVSSSVAAQAKAAKVLGCKKVVVAHPYGAHEDARLIADAERYGCEVLGVMGCGKVIRDFGRIPVTAALEMGRALMRAHPHADGIFFPSSHWPVIEAIEALEQEFGVAVMAASQACVWDALRLVGVDDAIQGYGRLLRAY
jgi:maleate cis-trans isomerase